MRRLRFLISPWTVLVVVPLVAIVMIVVYQLVPKWKDPESKLYASGLGYPAIQRLVGEPIEVSVANATQETIQETSAAAGETVGLVDVDLHSQLTGVAHEVHAVEGQRVRCDDPLMRLDPVPFERRVERLKNELAISDLEVETLPKIQRERLLELETSLKQSNILLAIATRRLQRYRNSGGNTALSADEIALQEEIVATRTVAQSQAAQGLAQYKLSSHQQLQTAIHTRDNNRILLAEAQADLEQSVIRAPCDGLISRAMVQRGELVVQQSLLFHLTDDVVFQAFVDQTRIESISIGQPSTVRLLAYPGQIIEGTVARINPTVDAATNPSGNDRVDRRYTFTVWIRVKSDPIPAGLSGYVEFPRESRAIVVPETAVIHLSSGEGMVLVAEGEKTQVRQVGLGRVHGDLRIVKTGLGLGERVVLHPRAIQVGDAISTSPLTNAAAYKP